MFGRSPESVETTGVASLNMLLDKTRSGYLVDHPEYIEPQHMRVESQARDLGALPVSLGLVMLQELYITGEYHNGEYLQEALGLKQGYWFKHNSNSRENEFLGVIGNNIDDVYAFDVGDDRQAVLVKSGDTVFVNIHHRSGRKKAEIRGGQMQRVLHEVMPFKKVVITGDSNSHSREQSRDMMAEAGFTSAYRMKGLLPAIPGMLPVTFPTDNYRHIHLKPNQARVPRLGLALDIMELKGFERKDIIRVGTAMTEKSDHKIVYGELCSSRVPLL